MRGPVTANDSACWQPASQAMTEQTARFYQARTAGQLIAFRHSGGNWYLSAPTPPVPATVPVGTGGLPLRRRVPPRHGDAR